MKGHGQIGLSVPLRERSVQKAYPELRRGESGLGRAIWNCQDTVIGRSFGPAHQRNIALSCVKASGRVVESGKTRSNAIKSGAA